MKKMKNKLGIFALASVLFTASDITVFAYNDYNASSTWEWAGEHIYWAAREGIAAGKANNCFDADGLITRAEAATMMVNFKGIDAEQYNTACEQFEDVGEKWYSKYVNAAYENDLFVGKTETSFDPDGLLTRAEAATVIVSAMGYAMETEEHNVFDDIEGEWFTNYINTAYTHEIVAGKNERVFEPNAFVTRAEMVTMLHATMRENYEMGMLTGISMYEIPNSFVIVNAEGESIDYNENRTEEEGGKYIANIDNYQVMVYTPTGWSVDLPATEALEYQCNLKQTEGIQFYGENCTVDISGTNIDKIQVCQDGTISLCGTDMSYMIEVENMANTLTFSENGADNIVLKIVEKQFVEVIK